MKKKQLLTCSRMQKGVALLSVLSTMAVALSGCSGDKAADSSNNSVQAVSTETAQTGASQSESDEAARIAAEDAATITVGIPQDLDGLDPHNVEAAGTREVLFNIFEGLVKPDAEGNINPAVASEWEVSDDGLTYTFTIRDGVKFHNGNTVTAEDVKFSLDRYKATGASSFEAVDSINVTDDTHVELKLAERNADFLSLMTVAIIPAGSEDTIDADPVGTGPYKFVSRSPQENVIVEKFADYWDAENAAHIGKVVFKVEANPDNIVTDMNGGSIDMFARVSDIQAKALNADTFEIYEGTMNLVQALYVNNGVAPFDKLEVRQALCYAINPQEIMDFVSGGAGTEIGSAMVPAFGKYFDESLNDTYNTDVEKAKELLAEAGYQDGFEFTIKVPSNYTPHVDTATVIAEELKAIGVTANIQKIEWNSWLQDVYQNKDYEATIIGFDFSTLNAPALLSRYRSDAHNNMFNYSSAEYDAAYANAQAATDDAEQTGYYKECAKILSETAAAVYIQDMPAFVAMNKKFTGYVFYPLYVQDMAKIRLAQW